MLQNQIKAVFIGIYMTGNVVLFLMAVYKLISHGSSLLWFGAALASGAVSCLFALYYGGWLPRTTRHIPVLLVATTLGTVLAGIGFALGGQVARKLGISHIGGLPLGLQIFGYNSDTVFPTVIVIDKNGKIVFIDNTENYRVRPGLEALLGALPK